MSDNESDKFEPEPPASSSAEHEPSEGAPPWNSDEPVRASQEQAGSPSAFLNSDQRGAGGAPDDVPSSPVVRPARDGVSVAALVLSIPGATLFAIPLGIWGLVRTWSGGRRGRGLAISALCISVAWIAAGLALVLSGVLSPPPGPVLAESPQGLTASQSLSPTPEASSASPTPSEQVTAPSTKPLAKSTRINWQKLKPRMCFMDPKTSAVTVKVVDCRVKHDSEVMLKTSLPKPKTWPGDAAMTAPLERVCRPAFEAYVGIGYDESHLDFSWVTTDTRGWNAGDHTTICLVYDPDVNQVTRALHNARE